VRLSISVSNHTTDDESPPRDSFGLGTFAMQSSGYLVTFEDGVVRKSVNVRLTDDYCQENPRDVLICTLSMVEHVGPIPSTCEENSCLGIAPSMASILITDREDAPPSSVQRLVFAAGVGNHRPTFELIIPNVAAAPFSLVTIAGGLHDNTTLIWPNASAAYIQHALESLTGIRRVEVRAFNATAELDARRFTLLFLDAYLVIDTLFVTVVEKKSSSSDDGGGDKDNSDQKKIRLNKVFKRTHSRREADRLIEEGRVSINGDRVVTKGGFFVIPYVDKVSLDGSVVKGWEEMNFVSTGVEPSRQFL
jgi:hypothetical protein